MKVSKFILIVSFFCGFIHNLHAQEPLDVRITIAPPYPVRLSDYTDFETQIFIDVNNPTSETYKIIFVGTLTNDERGIRIETDLNNLPRQCITIDPGLNRLTGVDLEDLFNPDHLKITGASLNQIRGDQALPEGNYSLCLRAFVCGVPGKALSPIPEMLMGCTDFEVAYVDPPVVINPECGSTARAGGAAITFNWLFTPPAGGFGDVRYKLRIVEIDPPGRNPFDVMNSATSPYLFESEELFTTSYNLLPDADVTLEEGKSYAFQVIAFDPTDEIQFRNNGASEVCYFSYGNSAGSEGFAFSATYPREGDHIPFDFFPFVLRYSPYSDDYFVFEGDFTLLERRGSSFTRIDDEHSRNRWPGGPTAAQRALGFSDITDWQAQHLPVYRNPTESYHPFQKGTEYGWEFTGEIESNNGTISEGRVERVTFEIGMSAPLLEQPVNGSIQEPGQVKLQWTTAKKPSSLVPSFDITQFSGSSPVNFFTSTIDERWVLEVSPETTFDSIYFTNNGRINDLVLNTVADSTAIIEALYKQEVKDTTFTEEGIYYWRVKWLSDPDNLSSEAYSTSPTWNFKIGAPSDTTTTEETPEGCVSDCLAAEITNTTAVAVSNGQTLKMGKFNLKITSLSSAGTNQYNGEGEITIGFLNNVRVKVSFTNIKANSENRIFSGSAKAMDDEPQINVDSVSTIVNGLPVSIPDFNDAQSDALDEVFETGERLVSFIGEGQPMGMPLGLDTEIDDYRFVIGITEMSFKPRKADITAVARVDIPDLGDKLPAFGARNVCITPSGLGDEYALYLARDHEIYSSGDFSFVFNGAMDGDTTKASYIEFDCTGFKCARLSGMVTLPSDKFMAENEDGTVDEDGHVTGTFAFKGCRGNNYMGSLEFSAFQVKGMKGWGFKPIVAYLDWSDLENPPGFSFPENYEFGSGEEPRTINTWKGFYLKELSLHAPPDFEHDVVGDLEANVQNVIIDDTGFTGSVAIMNLIGYDDGDVKGWSFSLDSLAFGIVQNTNISGGFRGKLGTPIFAEDDYLHYSTALGVTDGDVSYNFSVQVKDTLNIDIWKADIYFNPDSEVVFEMGSEIETHLTARLHGGISIEGALDQIPQLSFNGIRYEGLVLSTRDEFSIDRWSFASPEKSAAGFPVNINNIGFGGGFTNPAIDFDVGLTLSNAGFSAEVGFQLIGKVVTNSSGKKRLRYDRMQLDAISIDQQMDGGIKIAGELQFYRDDPVYGKGMRGDVAVTLPMDIAVNVAVQFGTIKSDPTARFNTAGYFSYWYVDGLVMIPGGITVFPGFAAYGFGGGAYHHMIPESEPPEAAASLTAGTSGGSSGVRYVPDFETLLGVKATIVLATQSSKETFNMDVGIEARFNRSGGLDSIGIRGDGYIMADIDERDQAKVTAHIALGYANDSEGGKRVSGNFDVYVRLGEIITGIGEDGRFVHAAMFADSEKWFFHMGKPMPIAERGGLKVDLKVLQAELTSYLMVGHDIPTTLPPLPDKIRELVYGPQQSSIEGATSASDVNEREMPAHANNNLQLGKGFAFGAHLDFETRLDFAIFYAKLGLAFGFDLNITQDSSRVCYETGLKPGINDWYATGQMYAALEGELGVQVNLWFVKGEFPIINLAAAFALRGGLPNPAWMEGRAGLRYSILGGLIKGHCNFKAQIGQKCSYVSPNPFADIEFISGFSPENGDTDVSVFTYPQVSFALPVHEILELPAGLEDEPEKVRVFYPFIHDITMTDERNDVQLSGDHYMDADHVSARFESVGAMEEYAQHKLEVTVRSREYFPNGTEDMVRVNGRVWEETKSSTFTTGARPDVIIDEQVSYTYPIDRQPYFLQNSTNNGRGLLKYSGPNQNYLFDEEDDNGNRYEFFTRFIKLEDESTSTGDISLRGRSFWFDLPTLESSTIYGVQVIRKKMPPPQTQQETQREVLEGTNFGSANSINAPVAATIYKALDLRGAGSLELQLNVVELLPAERAAADEKILYKFYFRTSQYNSFQEKINTVSLESQYMYANGTLFENVTIRGRMEEPFGEFEVNGLFKNGTRVLDPMITFTDMQSNATYRTMANYWVYDLHREVKRLDGRPSTMMPLRRYRVTLSDINSTRRGKGFVNTMPFKTIDISSSTDIGEPLQDWELDRAAGIGAYGENASSASPSSGSNSGSGSMFASVGGLSSGINIGGTNVFSGGYNFNPGSGSTATQDFGLIVMTSMYVKLDAQSLKSQLSRWMATRLGPLTTNAELLSADNSSLHRRISLFLTLPTSFFTFRNGAYNYSIGYRHPGFTLAPRVTKSFTINYHDESLR